MSDDQLSRRDAIRWLGGAVTAGTLPPTLGGNSVIAAYDGPNENLTVDTHIHITGSRRYVACMNATMRLRNT